MVQMEKLTAMGQFSPWSYINMLTEGMGFPQYVEAKQGMRGSSVTALSNMLRFSPTAMYLHNNIPYIT